MPKKFAIFTGLLASTMLVASAAQTAPAGDVPGKQFTVLPSDLPKPYATPAAANSAHVIARPQTAKPDVLKGFAVSLFASGLSNPRFMAVAPNGDIFLAEPLANKITLLRDSTGAGRADKSFIFAQGFHGPHGLALHDGALYVGDLEAVWRLPYTPGATSAESRSRITTQAFGGTSGHATRDIAFGPDNRLYVAIGSANNVAEEAPPRATVQQVIAGGKLQTFASGIRNPVGIAFYPGTDDLYVTVNERDGLGDGLVPDYLTRVSKGDFFGWPYAYSGPHPNPDFGSKRSDLVAKTKTPDVLFQAHSAPLGLVFYEASQFPAEYRGNAFVALHGSWNSAAPTGYKVVRVKFANGRPFKSYEDFATGFWQKGTTPAQVWGRPAGLAVAKDGSLLIADDAGKAIWRVDYTGK